MAHRVGALVTGNSTLAVMQLARELSSDASLQISSAITTAELWKQIGQSPPRVVLLDTQLAGEGTPQLIMDLLRQKIATLLRCDCTTPPVMLLDAMEAGALAILEKPASSSQWAESTPSILWNIRAAALANLSPNPTELVPVESTYAQSIVAIGAGMGGLSALSGILSQLPADAPATVVISPLPAEVITSWANRQNNRCKMKMKVATDGDRIQSGQVLIAPGDSHLLVRRSVQGFAVSVKPGPAVFHQRPSIEILFNSVAEVAGADAVGVLLGGAGVDGVAGLMRLRNRGGRTIAESDLTSVIAEGPSRAKKCGAVEAMIPSYEIAGKLMEFAVGSTLRAA